MYSHVYACVRSSRIAHIRRRSACNYKTLCCSHTRTHKRTPYRSDRTPVAGFAGRLGCVREIFARAMLPAPNRRSAIACSGLITLGRMVVMVCRWDDALSALEPAHTHTHTHTKIDCA